MADYPGTIKSFTDVVDGETDVEAIVVNEAYDEIEAVEAFIGAFAGGASYNESLKNLLKQTRTGCEVDYKGAADLYVRSGEIAVSSSTGNIRIRRNSSDLTVDWTNIDTGAEATSTVYYVYAVADSASTTFTVKISTSSSAPSGITYYRKIGTFYNDASGNIQEVANIGRSVKIGRTVTKTQGTTYLAITDGFAVAYDESAGGAEITGYTDASNPPTTVLAHDAFGAGEHGCFTMPVMAGNYWKVDTADNLRWVPLT